MAPSHLPVVVRRHGGVAPLVIRHLAFDLTVLGDWMAPPAISRLWAGSLAVAAVAGTAQLWTPRRRGAADRLSAGG